MSLRPKMAVQRTPFVAGVENDYGEAVDTWGTPETVYVYGLNYPDTSEPSGLRPNGLVVDRVMLIPKGLSVHPKDKFVLPDEPDEVYQVEGLEETSRRNPLSSWNPGGRINLRRTNG